MCLFPRLLKNPKYKPNKKNGGHVPPVLDNRVLYVPIKCNNCMECMKQKANEWKVRLLEEIKVNREATFVTLTFSDASLKKLMAECPELEGYEKDNWVAIRAVRLFTERWRKKYKKTIRHWLVTELGHNGTERIHLHGIVWSKDHTEIKNAWSYGWVWCGEYVNERTINYIVKYVTKQDFDHKLYKPQILTSNGIGANYTKSYNASLNKYQGESTKETYSTPDGKQAQMPIYYRNKIYTEEEREKLWLQKLDKGERWVDGVKCSNYGEYWKALETARKKNIRLGYRDNTVDWQRKEYEDQMRRLKHGDNNNKKDEKPV